MKNVQTSETSSTSISLQHSSPEVIQLATNYASNYLDYVENLPFDLQRNVTKLREVDQKCREHVKEIETLYEGFMKENDGSTGVRKRTYLLQIRRLFGLCKELGDEKIAIAQSMAEEIEMRNKQLEHGCRRFELSYEPNMKSDHNGKKDKEGKSEAGKGHKRSRRQRNNQSVEKQEKVNHSHKDQEKVTKSHQEDVDEPPAKVMASSSPEHSSITIPTPALTRAAQRDEDKRLSNKSSKDKKEEKHEKAEEPVSATTSSSTKTISELSSTTPSTTSTTSGTPSTPTTSKQNKNASASATSTNSTNKNTNKGKKKKRKSNKHQTEKQSSNSGEVSPIVDMPIDPDEPTYCLCQQVSFGQMIGCDNMKCPIEWFHFSCVRLTHKPKGKWFCPDCTTKRKREGKRGDNR
ncbi:inhibitor of growth protein 1-like [Styela clava]